MSATAIPTTEARRSAVTVAALNFLAGTTSGFAAKLIEYPFDTVKVLQQTQGAQYSSAINCFRRTISSRGFMGLYKGITAPLMGSMMENATLFVSYSTMKRLMGLDRVKDSEIPMWKLCLCGAGSGVAVSCVLTPIELVKCRLQAQQGLEATFQRAQYSGPIDVVRQTIRSSGVRGMFRGTAATLAREIPGNVAWFGVYEMVCKMGMKPGQTKADVHFSVMLSAGALSGVAYWTAFFPADTVKSKMQTDPRYSGMNFVSAFKHVHRNEGYRGLYRGLGVTVTRAAPAHALIFYLYENILRLTSNL